GRQRLAMAAARCRRHSAEHRGRRWIHRRDAGSVRARRARGLSAMHLPPRLASARSAAARLLRLALLSLPMLCIAGCALQPARRDSAAPAAPAPAAPAPWFDATLTPQQRAVALVSRMTLEEKAAQMQNDAPAIA